jgi:hypothetical protein
MNLFDSKFSSLKVGTALKTSARVLSIVSCMAFSLAVVPMARANTFSGVAYCDIAANTGGQGSSYAILTPTLAQLSAAEGSSAGQCATFSGSGLINFATGSDSTAAVSPGVTGGQSLANFLNYGGNLTSSTYFALAGANNAPATTNTGSQNNDGSLLVLTGLDYLTTGESLTLSHDDGAYIYICPVTSNCSLGAGNNPTAAGNYSLISPAGSGTQTTAGQAPFTYSGATGAYDFLLIYNSNYLQPSELQSNIDTGTPPSVTPEPGSLFLLGTGVLGAAGMIRRRILA